MSEDEGGAGTKPAPDRTEHGRRGERRQRDARTAQDDDDRRRHRLHPGGGAVHLHGHPAAGRGSRGRSRWASRSTASSSGSATSARSCRSRSSCSSSGSSSALILLLIEYAPRAGSRLLLAAAGSVLRSSRCSPSCCCGPTRTRVIYVVADRGHPRRRCSSTPTCARGRARDTCSSSIIFSAPAVILLLDRPHLPGDRDDHPVVLRQDRRELRRPRELRLDLHQPRGLLVGHQHDHLGARRAHLRDDHRARVRRVHRPGTRREGA